MNPVATVQVGRLPERVLARRSGGLHRPGGVAAQVGRFGGNAKGLSINDIRTEKGERVVPLGTLHK